MQRYTKVRALSLGVAICCASASLKAAPATDPATNPASTNPAATNPAATNPAGAPGVQAMQVHIAEVKGLVQVRVDDKSPWQPAKVGMVLDAGAEFRTGPRSSVTCLIPPDQTLTLDRLGTVKIAEAIKSGNKIKTDLIMKYGRTSYDIEAAGAEHESTIRSPSSTLAVRGTSVQLYDQPPYVPVAESFHGRASFRNAQRELRFGGTSFTAVNNNSNSPADTALSQQVVDPHLAASRSGSEAAYIANETSRGATFTFNQVEQIPVVRNGPGPLTDAELTKPGALPGALDFVLRWTGNTNLNLLVDDIKGQGFNSLIHFPSEILYPGYSLNVSANGGHIPYDDQGGKKGGMEIGYFDNPPIGVYGIGAIFISGQPTPFTINAYYNGQPLQLITSTDANGNPITTTTLSGTISKPSDAPATILFVPPQQTDTTASSASKRAGAGKTSRTQMPANSGSVSRAADVRVDRRQR